ncbi:hypothetical protein D3C71_1397110 [compost metagenome]
MQTTTPVDRENFVVDDMLQGRKEHAVVTLFVDYERDAVEATKYMLRRMGAKVDVAHASEAERNALRGHALSLGDVKYSTVEHAATSLLKLKRDTQGPVAVYARVSMRDPHTAEFLKVASAADHLVIVTV